MPFDLDFGLPGTNDGPPVSLSLANPARGLTRYGIAGLTLLFGVAALAFLVLAITGTARSYSPVPYWDMWNGYLGFYLHIHAGDWGALWAEHAEHRITLSRLFFWIDIGWFHGTGIFSFVAIYGAILAVAIIFSRIWTEQCQRRDLYILFFLEAWILSWGQHENLTWAFQSQFIFAQLLPLASLYALHLSASKQHHGRMYFVLAMLCGILAVGSMANGVLALPAMTLYASVVRMRLRRVGILGALSVAEILLYFHHYTGSHFAGAAPTLMQEVFHHPNGFLAFFLTYLGSPFIGLLDQARSDPQVVLLGKLLAAGLVLLCLSTFYRIMRRAERPTLPTALLVFIFYIMATAAVTASGRLPLGVNEALSSRYQTPVLYGWAAALLLYWPGIAKSVQLRNVFLGSLAVLLCCFMLPQQLKALTGHRNMIFQRELAALALELQIKDAVQISEIYPNADIALAIASQARAQLLSVFGVPPIENAHLLLGEKFAVQPDVQCSGDLDPIRSIQGLSQEVRASGWIFNAGRIKAPQMVYLVDAKREIMGLGLVGESRGDAVGAKGRKAKYSGFEAYLSAKAIGQKISVVSPAQGCELAAAAVRF